MAKKKIYHTVLVESFIPPGASGLDERVRIRPTPGQDFNTNLFVECSKALRNGYPVGTRFKIRATLTDREGGKDFLYSHYSWGYQVISMPQSK